MKNIFDRRLLIKKRTRASKNIHNYDFLIKRFNNEIYDRLFDFDRVFENCLAIGCRNNSITKSSKIKNIIHSDIAEQMLKNVDGTKVVFDEEFIPFGEETFDLIISPLNFHNINDLPGTLYQIKKILKTGGLFIASLVGGNSLNELRTSFINAELKIYDSIDPHIFPFIDIKSLASLMQRAGFSLQITDSEVVTVKYKNVMRIFEDLRGMGETNILISRSKKTLSKKLIYEIEQQYKQNFSDQEKLLNCTIEVLTATAIK